MTGVTMNELCVCLNENCFSEGCERSIFYMLVCVCVFLVLSLTFFFITRDIQQSP